MVLPGAIGLSAWFVVLLQKFPAVKGAVLAKPTEAYVVLALLAVALGLIFEDLGSRVETFMDNRIVKNKGSHMDNWYTYLRRAFKVEPIGERYLRTLVIRLKFELDTSVALISAAIGSFFLAAPAPVRMWLLLALVVTALYLTCEAGKTCDLLSKVREELLKGITVVGSDTPPIDIKGYLFSDPRIDAIRTHLDRYRQFSSQGKSAEAGTELEVIESAVKK